MMSEFVTAQVLERVCLAAIDGTAYVCRSVCGVVDFVKFLVSFDHTAIFDDSHSLSWHGARRNLLPGSIFDLLCGDKRTIHDLVLSTNNQEIMAPRAYSKTYKVPRRPFEAARLYVLSHPLC
jgi:hypothetical protein